jgi:hypothetical protein
MGSCLSCLCRVLIDNETEKNATLVKVFCQCARPSVLVMHTRAERWFLLHVVYMAQLRVTKGYLSFSLAQRFMTEFLRVFNVFGWVVTWLSCCTLPRLLLESQCFSRFSEDSKWIEVCVVMKSGYLTASINLPQLFEVISVVIFFWGSGLFILSHQASCRFSLVGMQLISNICSW